jgi:hypothetical protein
VDALAASIRSLIEDRGARTALGEAGPGRSAALCDPARQLARLGEVLTVLRFEQGASAVAGRTSHARRP